MSKFNDRFLLCVGNLRWNTDQQTTNGLQIGEKDLLHGEQKDLSNQLNIRDDSSLERPDDFDLVVRLPHQFRSFMPNGHYLLCCFVDGDDRGLIEERPLSFDIDEQV